MQREDGMVELLHAANEIEAREIESLLQQAGIECSLVSSVGTPYPSVGLEVGPWGRVLVLASQLEQAEALVADYFDSEPMPADEASIEAQSARERERGPAPKRPRLGSSVVWAALLVSVLFNAMLWVRLSALGSGKDDEGRVLTDAVYRSNFRYPYERRRFDVKGRHTTSWFDADDDGRTDFVIMYLQGGLEIRSDDADKNGSFERSVTYRDGIPIFTLLDHDGDGLFEVAGVPLGDTLAPPLFHDEDADGRYDLIECDHAGQRVRFDVRACAERR